MIFKHKNQVNKFLPGSTRVIVTVVIFLALIILSIIGYFAFKTQLIYQNLESGRNDISQALVFMDRGDFELANRTAKGAIDSFTVVSQELNSLQNNFLIRNLAKFNNDFKNLKYIASSAEVLSRSAQQAFALISDFEIIFSGQKVSSFSEFSSEEKTVILKKLYESRPEMQGIKANIDLALFYLNQDQGGYFYTMLSAKMDNFKEQLEKASFALNNLVSLSALVPVLTGYPDPVSYLLILQNSNELRPTGGFIGTYGLLTISLGDIIQLETHDSYHLDMPASLNKSFRVASPDPIKKYLGAENYYMRDSNWSPDWKVSAEKIQWFYREEMKASSRDNEILPLAGVIAITPELITDLMSVVGEIEVDGQKYNSVNFVEILQYEVEMAFREDGISEWDRKNIIGDILSELKTKLFKLNSRSWEKLAGVLKQNIAKKNILMHLNDENYRKNSADLDWDGQIKNSDVDYLMVVDANLAAFKTDRVMDKKIRYYLAEQDNGSLKTKVELVYKNNGWFDWQTTRYRSFTRIYCPLSSPLLNNSGFVTDSFVSGVEHDIVYPKTYFAGFMSIDPKKSSTMTVEYYLPREISEKIKKEKKYSIVFQKQAGNNSSFEVHYSFKNEIKSWSISGQTGVVKKINNTELLWSGNLNQDQYLEIYF